MYTWNTAIINRRGGIIYAWNTPAIINRRGNIMYSWNTPQSLDEAISCIHELNTTAMMYIDEAVSFMHETQPPSCIDDCITHTEIHNYRRGSIMYAWNTPQGIIIHAWKTLPSPESIITLVALDKCSLERENKILKILCWLVPHIYDLSIMYRCSALV